MRFAECYTKLPFRPSKLKIKIAREELPPLPDDDQIGGNEMEGAAWLAEKPVAASSNAIRCFRAFGSALRPSHAIRARPTCAGRSSGEPADRHGPGLIAGIVLEHDGTLLTRKHFERVDGLKLATL